MQLCGQTSKKGEEIYLPEIKSCANKSFQDDMHCFDSFGSVKTKDGLL